MVADAKEQDKWRSWDAFVASAANPGFRQSSWYAAFRVAHNGWSRFGTVLRDGPTIVGGSVVFVRSFGSGKCYYYIPDGPVFLEDDSTAEQEQVFRTIMARIERKRSEERQVVSHLCINPRWDRVPGFVAEFQEASHFYGSPRNTQCVDLSRSEADILAQMKPKGRYNIGLARRHGVSVVEDISPQGIADFLSIYQEMNARKHLEGHSPKFFNTLISMLAAAERGSVFFAEYQGARLATALVVYFGATATYYFGGSRDAHRNVMAPYLLHFEIMRRAKALGCRRYDLFGVAPNGQPNHSWADITAFKRKFGGEEVRLVPTLEHIYDPAAYQEWRAIEGDRSGDRGERR